MTSFSQRHSCISKILCQHQKYNFLKNLKLSCKIYYRKVKNLLGKCQLYSTTDTNGIAKIDEKLFFKPEFETQNTFHKTGKELCQISTAGSERHIIDFQTGMFDVFIPAFLKPKKEKTEFIFSSGGFLASVVDGFDITDIQTQKTLAQIINKESDLFLCITIDHQSEANKKRVRYLATSDKDLCSTSLKRMFMLNLHSTSISNSRKSLKKLFDYVDKSKVFIFVPDFERGDKFMARKSIQARELANMVGIPVAVEPKLVLEPENYSCTYNKITFKGREKAKLEVIYKRWVRLFVLNISTLKMSFFSRKKKKENSAFLRKWIDSVIGKLNEGKGRMFARPRGDPVSSIFVLS